MRTGKGARVGQYLALLGYLAFLAFPFLWLISTAFKPPRELVSLHPTWIPRNPTLANFRQAFDEQPLLQAALNSSSRRSARRSSPYWSRPRWRTSWPGTEPGSRRPPAGGWWSARRSRSCS